MLKKTHQGAIFIEYTTQVAPCKAPQEGKETIRRAA